MEVVAYDNLARTADSATWGLSKAEKLPVGAEELRLDYEDFLRQHGWERWPPEHPAMQRFKAKRCATLAGIHSWIVDELTRTDSTRAELGANAALSLLNLCCYLLDRQITVQAANFEEDGGFTERLYRIRKNRRG